MDQDIQNCPKCNTVMEKRLGMWECPSCGHEMSAHPQAKEKRPGLKQPWEAGGSSNDPGAQYRNNQPPPPAQLGQGFQSNQPGLYGGAGSGGSSYGDDPLRTEKFAFLGALVLICAIVGILAANDPSLSDAGIPGLAAWGFVGGAIAGAINAAIFALAFFSNAAWLKWTCIGCESCGLLGALMTLFGGNAAAQANFVGAPIAAIINVGLLAWVVFILWRDIQNQQMG